LDSADSSVHCWGDNSRGQLGEPAVTGFTDTRTPLSTLARAAKIAAGGNHTCAILSLDAEVQCWGANDLGQALSPAGADVPTPSSVGFTLADLITAGSLHTCAGSGGALTCWGDNSNGQLGDGTMEARSGQVTVMAPSL